MLQGLLERLPETPLDPARDPVGAVRYMGADWTAWMTERLHDVARDAGLSCLCKNRDHRSDFEGCGAGETRGLQRERLYDLTWYRAWTSYEIPSVIIEHENSYSLDAFLNDHWKLMFGWAPLRVSIGYARDAAALDAYLPHLNDTAARAGWRFPPDCEDLSLLGHRGMHPRSFRVLHRAPGATEWRDLSSLRAALERLRAERP